MAQLDERPILELGRNPIDASAPCGASAAEDIQYIQVMAELAKMDRIGAGDPDWYLIEQHCTGILSSKSKDFEVAAALGMALFKRCSYAGLAAGLGLMEGLARTFWDAAFPERPRRRKARIESLGDRYSEQGWFREHQPKPDDFDALDLCLSRAEALKTLLKEKMPDEPLEFDKFIRGLKEHAGKRPKPAADPAGAAASMGTGTAQLTATAGAGFAAGAIADVGGAVNAVLSAATFIRKADAADPLPYALVRIVRWARIALPTTDAGKYQNPPPESSLLDALTHQFSNGVWDHLLKNAESAFRSNDPLWLDLQRYACAALAGLGSAYADARHAVIGATAGLVQRLGSGLYELKFRTGVPLCSGETRMWIESEVAPAKASGADGGAMSNGKLQETSDKARQLAGAGKLREALQALQEGLLLCTQRRDRFLWKLRIAELCFGAQRLQLAAPLLEECHEEIQRYHIDEWEPTLAVEVAQTLYRCRKSLTAAEKAPTADALRGLRDSFARLCQLDPLAALAAEPAGP